MRAFSPRGAPDVLVRFRAEAAIVRMKFSLWPIAILPPSEEISSQSSLIAESITRDAKWQVFRYDKLSPADSRFGPSSLTGGRRHCRRNVVLPCWEIADNNAGDDKETSGKGNWLHVLAKEQQCIEGREDGFQRVDNDGTLSADHGDSLHEQEHAAGGRETDARKNEHSRTGTENNWIEDGLADGEEAQHHGGGYLVVQAERARVDSTDDAL